MLLNPFATDAFSLVSLTEAMNIIPNTYGKIRGLKLFKGKGVTTRTVMVEQKNGVLNLLTTMPVGAPGQKLNRGLRNVRSFVIPHIPAEDVILPQEYDSIRAFGKEGQTAALAAIMNDHLETAKSKYAITDEYHKMCALKGQVLDADDTVLFDWYKEFLIQRKQVDFLLGTGTTNIGAKCREVLRHMETNLHGETMSGVHCLVDKDFFEAFVNHAVVKTAYERWRDGQALRSDMRTGFPFSGITFEEYEGTVDTFAGVAKKFLASKDGVAFPIGTQQTFRTNYAPADFLETVNTRGKEFYAKQEPRKFNRGIDIHMQSNPMNMVMRPALCVRVYTSTT